MRLVARSLPVSVEMRSSLARNTSVPPPPPPSPEPLPLQLQLLSLPLLVLASCVENVMVVISESVIHIVISRAAVLLLTTIANPTITAEIHHTTTILPFDIVDEQSDDASYCQIQEEEKPQ